MNHGNEEPNTPLVYNRQVEEVATYTYKECLKNHAASIGGNALDGCGEFMPSFQPLECSACGCHRNFHRKEVEAFFGRSRTRPNHNKGTSALEMTSMQPAASPNTTPSESNDHGDGFFMRPVQRKKRFRTKFSQEQKEKLLSFAEEAGWKMQKLDESAVQHLCQEIGIKRKVLKVWMHNNKQNYVNKNLHLH